MPSEVHGRTRIGIAGGVIALVAAALATLVLAGMAAAPADAAGGEVRVMTRNLYLGADLVPLILTSSREQFKRRATETWQQVQRTNFPARARLLAREIDHRNPDLIGMQEVALWRRGPSDGRANNASRVVYNFLELLQSRLKQRGERYRTVEVQREADLEGPTDRGFDVRLTMRDAILMRRGTDLRAVATRSHNFSENLVIPTVFGPKESTRGWTAADFRLHGKKFRFVNTHLEAYHPGIRAAQAEELTQRRGALQTQLPTALVGDLNSDPKAEPTPRARFSEGPAAYRIIKETGFRDAWLRTKPGRRGLTCCLSAEVDDRRIDFDSRIDYVLFRRALSVKGASRVGIDPDNRTASGLWPSDHAGVVATLKLR